MVDLSKYETKDDNHKRNFKAFMNQLNTRVSSFQGIMRVNRFAINRDGENILSYERGENYGVNIEIFFSPNRRVDAGLCMMQDKESAFIYIESPLSRGGIATLLHELGHVADHLEKPDEYIRYDESISNALSERRDSLTDIQLGRLLSAERNAWAYAYQKLKMIKDDIGIDLGELKQFSHDLCLDSYHDAIHQVREKRGYNSDFYTS